MFESILGRNRLLQSRLGTGAAFSMALHAGAIALILWGSTATTNGHGQRDRAVKFIKPMDLLPPSAPPPPRLAPSSRPPQREHRLRKMGSVVQPKEAPEGKPAETEPASRPESTTDGSPQGKRLGVVGGVLGGATGGVAGGMVEGMPGGQLGGALDSSALPFGEGMTRPERIHGDPPGYTREALAAGIQGNMLVKCLITTGGKLENCRIIKGLPHMEKAALDALSTWRYKPVRYQGRPVAVDYLIQIRLVIPRRN